MIYWPLLIVQLFCSNASQTELENSLLWKVSKPGMKKVSFIYGTMHTADERMSKFPKVIIDAIDQCDVYACEVDISSMEIGEDLLGEVWMSDSVLSDFYSPEEWKEVKNGLQSRMDPLLIMTAAKLKPFYTMSMLGNDNSDAQVNDLVDGYLLEYAHEQKKDVLQLETPQEALAVVDAISLREQAMMLLETLRKIDNTDSMLQKLNDLYLSQDLNGILQVYNDDQFPIKLHTAIVLDRNQKFSQGLMKAMKKKAVFCAIGALHLPGESGMISTLRKAGYTVEPVFFTWEKD